MSESEELLQRYAASGSEEAFGEIVRRHLNLVYGTARRLAGGDAHEAEDVAQMVFRDLALKAAQLPRGTIVAGWLYRHTCFTAAKVKRSNRRRVAREEGSSVMNTEESADGIAERLEPALEQLSKQDRLAIVLRYLEERDWNEVSATLGVSVEAAQKRGSRALEKLRGILAKEGTSLSVPVLAACLAAQNQAAPVGLAVQVSSAALTNLSMSMSTPFLTTIKSKVAALALAGLVASAPLVWQRQQLKHVRLQNAALRDDLAALRQEFAAARTREAEIGELERLRRENAELHKLRGEIGTLRRQLEAQRAMVQPMPAAGPAEAALEKKQVTISTKMAAVAEDLFPELQALGIAVPPENSSVLLSSTQASALEKFFTETEGVDFLTAPKVTTLHGRQARVSIEDTQTLADGTQFPAGHVVDVLPAFSPDGASISLDLKARLSEFLGYSDAESGQALPRFRVRESSAHRSIGRGETLLLQLQDQAGSDPNPADRRKLLLLVAPMEVASNGHPVLR